MSPKCSIVENDGELMLMALHTHFLPTAAIFLRVLHCFWLFTLWFIDEDASFFHFFFSQDNKHKELTLLLFFQNPYAIFAHTFCNITMIFNVMLQYFPALFKRIHNHICNNTNIHTYIHTILNIFNISFLYLLKYVLFLLFFNICFHLYNLYTD